MQPNPSRSCLRMSSFDDLLAHFGHVYTKSKCFQRSRHIKPIVLCLHPSVTSGWDQGHNLSIYHREHKRYHRWLGVCKMLWSTSLMPFGQMPAGHDESRNWLHIGVVWYTQGQMFSSCGGKVRLYLLTMNYKCSMCLKHYWSEHNTSFQRNYLRKNRFDQIHKCSFCIHLLHFISKLWIFLGSTSPQAACLHRSWRIEPSPPSNTANKCDRSDIIQL